MDLVPRPARARRQEGQVAQEEEIAGLRGRIERYYGAKVRQHGATPEGVDWTCSLTQELRFVQLLRVCDWDRPFSLDDLGCGWGALRGFISRRHRGKKVDYLGIDLSSDMISRANAMWKNRRSTEFRVGSCSSRVADYSVASGLFNVRIDEPVALWEEFIARTLRSMAQTTRIGFAANFLATLPDGMAGVPQLYRTAADPWVRFCERDLGMRVTLVDTYGMREFTLLARH